MKKIKCAASLILFFAMPLLFLAGCDFFGLGKGGLERQEICIFSIPEYGSNGEQFDRSGLSYEGTFSMYRLSKMLQSSGQKLDDGETQYYIERSCKEIVQMIVDQL